MNGCAVKGCEQAAIYVRETASGYPVGYCVEHGRQADALFGDPDPQWAWGVKETEPKEES